MNNSVERGQGVEFERIRRVTGYLCVLSRFNDGKRAEEHDRYKHEIKMFNTKHNDKTGG